jgi:hypothetical protein
LTRVSFKTKKILHLVFFFRFSSCLFSVGEIFFGDKIRPKNKIGRVSFEFDTVSSEKKKESHLREKSRFQQR